ncbi:AraC family transcriptional regulator [Thalassotalea sp. PLHSN55]|uniref:AraC family transcriptional regulator n=1 Tax=Thalassotalea sp. PLHSN55 TaxID=3435888 RepID=UPI003F828E1D
MAALIRASALIGFDDIIRRYGEDPYRLMDLAGLAPVYLKEPDLYLPYSNFVKLLELSAVETNNAFLGAEFGLEQGIRVIGPTEYLVSSSSTLEDALQAMQSHFTLQTSGARVQLSRFDGHGMLSYEIIAPTASSARQVMDNACAIGIRMMRTFLGNNWKPTELYLQHSVLPDERRRYSQLFGMMPRFDAEHNGILFDASTLNSPLPKADAALHNLVERQLNAMQAQHTEDLPLRVQGMIHKIMPTGQTSLASIAQLMAMSPRSLQRKLSEQGTSFQTLFDGARKQVAEHYLRHSNLQLTQVADILGFKCISNFTHAFQRWHGMSPRAWKKTF